MANSFVGSRAQFLFALCLPVAVLLGYLLSDPADPSSLIVMMLIVGVLSVPLLMHSYHALLLFTWNAAISPFFLPGQPSLWMVLAFVGFGFAVINRFTNREARWIPARSITKPLLLLLGVTVLTAYLRGGLGMRIFGSASQGGKGYFYITASIIGYFVLTSQHIPKDRAWPYVAVFFLSSITSLIPNLAYLGGPTWYPLFYIFPSTFAYEQVVGDVLNMGFTRLYGLTLAPMGVYCWLMARYGLRGIFDLTKPLRLLFFLASVVACLFCGFRAYVVILVLTVIAQFFVEKLYRPRTLLPGLGCLLVVCAVALPNAEKLPMVVQRSISFLPVRISPAVRAATDGSSEWRLNMWRDVVQEIPQYLIKGKGYAMNPDELEMAMYATPRGLAPMHAWALVTGAYHNGPLTLLIPLGLGGLLAFLWFAAASIRYLYRNMKYGDPDLLMINRFLFGFFVVRFVFYLTIFGNFFTDLFIFTGLIGLSVSLNGTQAAEAKEPALSLEEEAEATLATSQS